MHKMFKTLGYLSFPLFAVVIAIYFQRFEVFHELEQLKAGFFQEKSNKIVEPFFKADQIGNYEPEREPWNFGPGENGTAVNLLHLNEKEIDNIVGIYGYNTIASDMISLDRKISDFRNKECLHWNYQTELPNASVIIVFFNEGLSTLLRTIHSVIKRTPKHLLEEIILIDDGSQNVDLKEKLQDYIRRFENKVKLYRNTRNEGLIKSRVIGIQKARGETVVILDAHCECSNNWLPPLLSRIKLNRKAMAVPIINQIDWKTFEHRDLMARNWRAGIFEWGLLYKEIYKISIYPNYTRKYESEPYWSPTHAGGLFAIDRKWFNELGIYDTGIKIWGGEQYELSFKIWQCGGIIEWVPCSHVAHVYKGYKFETFEQRAASNRQISTNHLRVVHVWMDEFKEHFFTREPYTRHIDYGDVSQQLKLKKSLKCKSFKWYMENIAFDMLRKFPLPPKNAVWGHCINEKNSVCMQNKFETGGKLGVYQCADQIDQTILDGQLFRLNVEGELSESEYCFDSINDLIIQRKCIVKEKIWFPVGEWSYDKVTGLMTSKTKGKCMETNGSDVWLADCDQTNPNQKWLWKEIYY